MQIICQRTQQPHRSIHLCFPCLDFGTVDAVGVRSRLRNRLMLAMAARRKDGKRRQPPACAHCGECKTVWRRRGLCWQCFKSPALRKQYRKQGRFYDTMAQGKLPPKASTELPGSEERIREIMRRVAARQDTHHPGDRRLGSNDLR